VRVPRRTARVGTCMGAERAGGDLGSRAARDVPAPAPLCLSRPCARVRRGVRHRRRDAVSRDHQSGASHRALGMKRPSVVVRAATAAFRRVPPIRGRGRAETVFHRWLAGSGLADVIRVNGYSLEVSLDDIIGRTIYLNGIWERENTAVVRRLLRPGDRVFDVGANTGYYSLLFSQ